MSVLFEYIFLVFSLVWFVVFGYVLVFFSLKFILPFFFFGAPYVASQQSDIEKIIEVAQVEIGQKAVDLGAGDGSIIIALAKKGVETHGYEINPVLVAKAHRKINELGLGRKAFMHQSNFWHQDISPFDVIIIYGISFAMGRLEKKLEKEAKSGAKIISNYFALPHWQPLKKEGRIYLYKK